MSGLLAALERLEGRRRHEPPASPVVGPIDAPASTPTLLEPPSPPEPAQAPAPAPSPPAAIDEPSPGKNPLAVFVDALSSQCPPPSLAAFLSVGVAGSITGLLREHAEAVVERIGRDVVLLGPGLLDDPKSLESQWDALRRRAAYGFLHAESEYALARLGVLGSFAAVVPVVELGTSSATAVARLRRLLAIRRIKVLGAVVVEK
jgi:hypothetical protein